MTNVSAWIMSSVLGLPISSSGHVVLAPVASAAPEMLLKMQILLPAANLSQAWGTGVTPRPLGDSTAHWRWRTIPRASEGWGAVKIWWDNKRGELDLGSLLIKASQEKSQVHQLGQKPWDSCPLCNVTMFLRFGFYHFLAPSRDY